MADQTISDAVIFPEDDGTGVPDENEDFDSGGYYGLMARHADGEYVAAGLQFSNVASSETDITAGFGFIVDDVSVTNSGRAGPVSVQSADQQSYDTDLPANTEISYLIMLPTDVTNLSLDAAAVNDIYLYHDVTTNDSVQVRYGSTVTDPVNDATPKPSIKLGTVDTSDDSTTRANDKQVLQGGAAQVVQAVHKLSSDDGTMSGKTLESGEAMTVESDESFVISDEYTVNGDLTINGSMTVM